VETGVGGLVLEVILSWQLISGGAAGIVMTPIKDHRKPSLVNPQYYSTVMRPEAGAHEISKKKKGGGANLRLIILSTKNVLGETENQKSWGGSPQRSFLGRRCLLPRLRDTSLSPRLRHALHDRPAAQPAHVDVHQHDVVHRARSQRRVLARRRTVLVRDGGSDGRAAGIDKSHGRRGHRGEDDAR
jgi:hypothetical protein